MMCYGSSSSASKSNNNNNTCNNKYICGSAHSIGSDVDCNCSWLTAASTTISAHASASSVLASKQRSSSSYKKYRRAKALNDVQSSSDSSSSKNSNKVDASRLDHCSSSRSSVAITSLTPASAPTTATASKSCSSTLHRRRRRLHVAAPTAYSSAAASSSFVAVALAAGLSICRAFSLSICMLLLLRVAPSVRGIAVGVDTANANITDLGSPAPKYQTAYACEGKKLTIECDPGDLINLIRANYGRFSITICNDHGNVEWSVNCMFPKSLTVLNSKCAHKQSCSVLATTSMFGDPCPGTHKYLEAHYQCISAAQTSTTTNRPSPPWVLANNPPLLANGSTLINPSVPLQPQGPGRLPLPANGGIPSAGGLWHTLPPTPGPPQPTLPGGRMKGNYNTTVIKNSNRHDGLPPPPPLHHHHHTGHHAAAPAEGVNAADSTVSNTRPTAKNDLSTRTPGTNQTKSHVGPSNTTTTPNTRILSGVGGSGTDDGTILTAKTAQNRGNQQQSTATQQHAASNNNNNVLGAEASGGSNGIRTINNINNLNMGLGAVAEDESNMFCGPTNARNLFWNITRVGDVNVQPCPGGATGIAKWRCVLMKRVNYKEEDGGIAETTTMRAIPRTNCSSINGNSSCENVADRLSQRIGNFEPTWHPMTPDLTQCRSLWLNSLEVRVNQRESSVISIANDLSEVTSSKTLYGGDMLVTTKIIQTMSEKMFHDKETLPDQRQREAIILELLHGVVKTGSNLLDESQLSSWMDLNQEDQMRVATSLLTGLEYNAFLLADTIIRERNIVQKVKNILLSVRVLETKNIQGNEVFPDLEQWQISDDRIELPRTALVENSEGGLVRIVFAAFDRLESILKPSYDHFDTKSSRSYVRNTALLASERNDSGASADLQQQRIRILNSKVISASLGKGRHIQLSQPIKLVLRHIKTENVTNPTCVFWNYIDHAWSANGCTLESTNRTHSICMCNHLTNFAILMDVMDEHNHSLFGVFDGNMRILIYISVAICLVFVVIALLTLKIFNGVFIKVSGRRNRRGGGGSQIGGGSQRQRSGRCQNNIRDQTHETLAITTTTSATAATASGGQPAPTNNIQNIQQQLNLQHIPNIMGSAAGGHHGTTAPTNFIQHNSIRNSNRNNLNANNFNLQQQAAAAQQQQQQQQQQVVAAAAAAVVVAQHNQRNLQMNNLNLNLNLQPPHHHNPHGHNLNQPATSTHMHVSTATAHTTPHHGSMETSMSNTTSVAAMAAAATIAAALQHAGSNNNLNVNRNNSNNNVGANNRLSDANTNTNNIIMQGNMEDLQYKWWWW